MKGYDAWLCKDPFFDTSDAYIEDISESISDEFFGKNEDFLYTDVFLDLADKICYKSYFEDFKKSALLIERLFYLYKL